MFRNGRLPVLLPAAAALAAVAVACDDAQAPADDVSVIAVSVSVDRDSLPANETVHVTISASNPTDRRVTLRQGERRGPPLDFEVRSADGTLVRAAVVDSVGYNPILPVMDPSAWVEFGPGETREAEFGWTPQRGAEAFAPGCYAVTGLLNVPGGPRSDPAWVEVLPI